MTPRRVVVLSRPDCTLCSELLGLLAPYTAAGTLDVTVRDLDDEPPPVRERQRWRIPVVLDGNVELMWGRIDREEIERVFGPAPAR